MTSHEQAVRKAYASILAEIEQAGDNARQPTVAQLRHAAAQARRNIVMLKHRKWVTALLVACCMGIVAAYQVLAGNAWLAVVLGVVTGIWLQTTRDDFLAWLEARRTYREQTKG